MNCILGIDTSNYTTSVALYDVDEEKIVASEKMLLPVKQGELGVRQSDAVFHHTVQLPLVCEKTFKNIKDYKIVAVSVSEKPCEEEGSYMPCFLAGVSAASITAKALGVPLYKTTHQIGHILACLYSANKLELIKKDFLCFHVSGGTTQALKVSPKANAVTAEVVAQSLDLKAGQAIDRIGVKLGKPFPAGKYLDELAQESTKLYKKKGAMKGENFCLSGVQNLAEKMITDGETDADAAKFTIDYIANTLECSALKLKEIYGDLPITFAGGVMSNKIIRERFEKELGAYFCEARFSADNAAGIAVYGRLNYGKISSKRKPTE